VDTEKKTAEEEAEEWHREIFGPIAPSAVYRKLLEEIGELGEAIMENDELSIEDELADVAFSFAVLIRKLREWAEYPDEHTIEQLVRQALMKNKQKIARTEKLKEQAAKLIPEGYTILDPNGQRIV